MKHGHLHCEVYDLIKGSHASKAEWSACFQSQGNSISMIHDPRRMDLSPFEIDLLNAIAESYQEVETWELPELTHEFQEWVQSLQTGTARPISSEQLVRVLDFSEEEIAGSLHEAESHSQLMQRLGE